MGSQQTVRQRALCSRAAGASGEWLWRERLLLAHHADPARTGRLKVGSRLTPTRTSAPTLPAHRPRTESEADLVALEKEHGTGVARLDKPPKIVNAELIGSGLKLVYDKVRRAPHLQEHRPPALPPPSNVKETTAAQVAAAALSRNFVLTVGGDHSIAAGSISALSTVYPDLGVIWIDAHADANTPDTSP